MAAVAAQLGAAFGSQSQMLLRYYRAAGGTAYEVSERHWTNQNSQAFQPTLMRHQQSRAVAQPGVYSLPGGGRMVTTPLILPNDPRLSVVRRPPAAGFDIVEAYAAGWPMHAAHSLTHIEAAPGTARREHGMLRIGIGGHWGPALVIPALPIWTGVLGNTLLYGGAPFLAWWLLRGRRMIQRRAAGQCLACGYPLDNGMARCPECGAPHTHMIEPAPLANGSGA